MYVGFPGLQNALSFRLLKAEYVALGDAVKELLFLRLVWRFMLPSKVMPCFPVFEDSQGAVQLVQNPVTNSNSKHIDVRHHFLRELVRQRGNLRRTRSRIQIRSTLTCAIIFFENLSTRGILK